MTNLGIKKPKGRLIKDADGEVIARYGQEVNLFDHGGLGTIRHIAALDTYGGPAGFVVHMHTGEFRYASCDYALWEFRTPVDIDAVEGSIVAEDFVYPYVGAWV